MLQSTIHKVNSPVLRFLLIQQPITITIARKPTPPPTAAAYKGTFEPSVTQERK